MGDAAEERVFGKFDTATAVFLFNYADDARTLEKMFSNVAANLKPDGELVAVIPNPDFVNGLGDTIKYGFTLEVIEKRRRNLRVSMDFLGPESFLIKFTQWDRLSYETAMQRLGFEEIAWIPFSVSPEGIARQGDAYWTELLDNPKSIVLRAKKRRLAAAPTSG